MKKIIRNRKKDIYAYVGIFLSIIIAFFITYSIGIEDNVPMIEIDCTDRENFLDEQMMLREVICDDADLYYLDCFLTEMFAKKNE